MSSLESHIGDLPIEIRELIFDEWKADWSRRWNKHKINAAIRRCILDARESRKLYSIGTKGGFQQHPIGQLKLRSDMDAELVLVARRELQYHLSIELISQRFGILQFTLTDKRCTRDLRRNFQHAVQAFVEASTKRPDGVPETESMPDRMHASGRFGFAGTCSDGSAWSLALLGTPHFTKSAAYLARRIFRRIASSGLIDDGTWR